MRFSTKWQDYELIDCSSGKRLERWGDKILIRPDPQVIWNTGTGGAIWKSADAEYFRSKSGGGSWKVFNSLPPFWSVRYGDLTFNVKTMGFKHTGIFPEQAVNWDFIRTLIKKNPNRNLSVLNMFAYTGAATVACLKEGASVVHVDASKGMTSWAKENARLSGVDGGKVRWIVDDCVKFARREIRRGHKYDIIILDPPSYGRGPKGEIWHLEDSIYEMITLVSQLLSNDALAIVLNSYTAGLSPYVMKYILDCVVVKNHGGRVLSDEIGIKVTQSGGILPCGSTAVWTDK